MKASQGFTVVELLVALTCIAAVGAVAWGQYQALGAIHRDQDRKVAINAMHYNLEEVVQPTLGGYPRILQSAQLGAIEPGLLKDPHGVLVGNKKSDYRYEPTGCNGGDICEGYTLRADLEHESDFIKTNG